MSINTVLFTLAGVGLASAQTTIKSSLAGGNEVYDGFVSFSIEFSSFPDFAGNSSKPNTFSNTLLENIGNIIGTKPYIRVGGNTQDFALYDASLPIALKGIYDSDESDYPTTVTIGPSYFESYGTWDATKFSHGFNMALGATTADGWKTLLDTVPLACKALSGGKLYYWEYGNEPNLYPAGWDESTYVDKYLNGTSQIKELVKEHCPDLATGDGVGFLAPSFSGAGTGLDAAVVFQDGIDSDGDIKLFSTHNYISGADSPGVTLQGTLMNHESTTSSVDAHVVEYDAIKSADSAAPPMILGETNSLYNQGQPGLSNTFGAALWGVDFNLYSASVGIKRVHMHQGTDYRYASWQPITTDKTPIGTKAPYYGNIAVAAMLGNLVDHPSMIASVPLSGGDNQQAAYAAYVDSGSSLVRVLVLNLNAYNSTVDGKGVVPLDPGDLASRPSRKYSFSVEGFSKGTPVLLQRLWASGSDAISGITWDGYSYNYEEAKGKPVRMKNVTIGETVAVGDDGVVNVEVPDSSAVMLDFGKTSAPQSSGLESPQNHGEPSSHAAQGSESQKSEAGRNIMGSELYVFFGFLLCVTLALI